MATPTRIGLAGLAVMGQNLALNIAEKGFPISVYNRTTSKVDETVERAKVEGNLPVHGFHDPESFVHSIQKPRVIIMLVKAGAPVDQTIKTLLSALLSTRALALRVCLPVLLILIRTGGNSCLLIWSKLNEITLVLILTRGLM
ncbi:6-phosphogluconate dehydrogenase, decarboxylating like [Actinidia chinensis var. chinensis]|uniref:6-phosphogluconate dehydrogenase, decarboxylating like n=1 Tax=Actinidia chinensis var. chinensis TaxID=1590841 RepID=A0A2R6PB36_ACTCC|nr:6-phosphogluconate dehydrogenase, decarboxylating like [Actinidia chinensis var. chinensis]